jgi:hypothetical protein
MRNCSKATHPKAFPALRNTTFSKDNVGSGPCFKNGTPSGLKCDPGASSLGGSGSTAALIFRIEGRFENVFITPIAGIRLEIAVSDRSVPIRQDILADLMREFVLAHLGNA